MLTSLSSNHFHAKDGRLYFYAAARATDKRTCESYLDKIKKLNPVAGKKMADAPRHEWAIYATRGNVVWDQVTSNMSESTNNLMGAEVSSTRLPTRL